ncbi:MAG: choline-sulfatase [Chloroflexota bacterium]|nr:choline-sulfatase [Chloroflexota bacterium]
METTNVLMIVCDQMVARLMGTYGHPIVKTPNLDRLAAEGVRFDSAYSPCPICSPTRQSLITGKYASNINCFDNTSMLAADVPTLSHYLSIAGYDTVLSGKMHFVGPDQLHGFEKRLTTEVFPADLTWLPQRPETGAFDDYADLHEQPIAIDYVSAGVRQWSMQLDYDAEVHFRALEYLRSKRSQYTGTLQKPLPPRDERPFFLCVSYCHPHEPFHATQELWDLYEGKEIDLPAWPKDLAEREHAMDRMLNAFHGTHQVDLEDKESLYNMRRAYYALITYVDQKVGELIQTLEDCGLNENTLVVFISDHGDMLGERRMVQKRTFYEYSSQVPWIMSHPSLGVKGVGVHSPVSLVDLMPTLLDFIGFPAEEIAPIDGRSALSLLQSEEPDRVAFSELHCEGVNTTCFMVRQGDYKYIHVTGYDPQLYHVVEDPQEWNNLAGQPQYVGLKASMHALLMEKFEPANIEQRVRASLARRKVIRQAMQITGLPKWDYQPVFDATKQYWREG